MSHNIQAMYAILQQNRTPRLNVSTSSGSGHRLNSQRCHNCRSYSDHVAVYVVLKCVQYKCKLHCYLRLLVLYLPSSGLMWTVII